MSCFDTASVMGWRREPAPPASIIPFMENLVDVGPQEMAKQILVRTGEAGVVVRVLVWELPAKLE